MFIEQSIRICSCNKELLKIHKTHFGDHIFFHFQEYNNSTNAKPLSVLNITINNPAKSEIVIIRKHYLKLINSKIREKTQVNQWRNTKSVTEWFKAIKKKKKSSSIKFDIPEFYPSMSKKNLSKSIEHVQSMTNIEEKVIKTIFYVHKSPPFDKNYV